MSSMYIVYLKVTKDTAFKDGYLATKTKLTPRKPEQKKSNIIIIKCSNVSEEINDIIKVFTKNTAQGLADDVTAYLHQYYPEYAVETEVRTMDFSSDVVQNAAAMPFKW